MRLLLDTNLLIDYFTRREPFFAAWARLRCAAWFDDVELWVSAKSFTDVFYLTAKVRPSAEVQRAFLESLSFLHVCSIDGDDIARAAQESWPDFEDCLVAVAADKIGATCILTRDRKGFTRSKMPAMEPKAFFDWLLETHHISYDDIDIDGTTWHCSYERADMNTYANEAAGARPLARPDAPGEIAFVDR